MAYKHKQDAQAQTRRAYERRQATRDGTVALLLRAEEVAGLLGVSTRYVWKMMDQQILPPPIRIGRTTRWRRTDIEAWVTGGCLPRDDTDSL